MQGGTNRLWMGLTCAPVSAGGGLHVAHVSVALGAVLRFARRGLLAEGVHAALRPAVRQVYLSDLASTGHVTY